eukprot:TRINITY_DN3307_c0_g2_i1.p1 TRINITY_DN3307_c0_g2~~TRINITY_DN3307_c0_g2_i1.p1  ORF type:complete len:225 (+),score=17.12 TRINITY_DN3307_c0_g2_i1:38-712(+)
MDFLMLSWVLTIVVPILALIITQMDSLSTPLRPRTKKKILILDLDETLVHSTTTANLFQHNFRLTVRSNDKDWSLFVIKRPHVEYFLKEVSKWYELVVFTAGVQDYADPLVDNLDKDSLISSRLFRDTCTRVNRKFYIKDLDRVGFNLADTIILDNSPISYLSNPRNAVPIVDWIGSNNDDIELLYLLPLLYCLTSLDDVRSILGLRMSDSDEGRSALGMRMMF